MGKEAQGIRLEAAKLMWFSRGGLSYVDSMNLSNDERKVFGELIKENMETTKKSGLPFF
jgi:hypothetical protein